MQVLNKGSSRLLMVILLVALAFASTPAAASPDIGVTAITADTGSSGVPLLLDMQNNGAILEHNREAGSYFADIGASTHDANLGGKQEGPSNVTAVRAATGSVVSTGVCPPTIAFYLSQIHAMTAGGGTYHDYSLEIGDNPAMNLEAIGKRAF